MWAPDVTFKNGVYYCYYSVSASYNFNSAIGVTTNATLNPSAPNFKWTDQGMVIDSLQAANGGPMVNVIDPSTITDDNGKWYLAFGSFQDGVRMVELNPANGLLLTTPPAPTMITNHAGEGSAVAHWKSYYYYAISQGKCCAGTSSTYYISYARATSILGPYTTREGGSFLASTVDKLLVGSNNASSPAGTAIAVGVGGFFWDGSKTLDTLFMDYMAYTATSGNPLLNIKPLYADSTGWLTFDSTKGTVITRLVTTAVNNGMIMKPAFKNAMSVRLVNICRTSGFENSGEVYSITGRKLKGGASASLPAGIVIESIGGEHR
jgi:arabinan endo-1,5-alpha-L-arabinosidase